MSQSDETNIPLKHVESAGPWPFISRHVLLRSDGEQIILRSRHHRKGLYDGGNVAGFRHWLWMPGQLNWWIGSVFSLGALLFMLGSALVLVTALNSTWTISSNVVNIIFFTGSLPFTVAAYLQLFQAANAGEILDQVKPAHHHTSIFGWQPQQIGWLSCALQFMGTLLFNINTFDAMLPGLDWVQQDLDVWLPNFTGSILFLLSGYLAFMETCHAHWAWKPDSLSWWVTFVNFFGCVAFMVSAVFAFVPPITPRFDAATISVLFTFVGGLCFLAGSLLMLPESAMVPKGRQYDDPEA